MQNLLQTFLQNTRRLKSRPCFQFKKEGKWRTITWTEAEEEVVSIALGLKALGIRKGDRVGLFSVTCVEWTLSDLAIQSLGAITVPVYHSNTAEQAEFILQNSGARVVFVGNQGIYDRVQDRSGKLPELEKVVLFSGRGDDGKSLSWDQLKKLGSSGDRGAWRQGIDQIHSSDPATLVYTSGTTGNPKGAILTHGNFVMEVEALSSQLCDIGERDVAILFLPLAHIVARVMQFFQISVGYTQAYAESVDKLIDNMGEVRPHFFVSVPRIFEKVYERVLQQVEQGSPLKKAVFSWATAVGRQISLRKQERKSVSPLLRLQGEIATLLVFGKLQKRLGGRLRYAVSGGAPLSKEIAEFFHAAGILILEGYGLTETTAAININTPKELKFGTVGKPVRGTEEKIAPDGEILVRGPLIFQGYYKNPEGTREAFTDDGWFKTGDVGEMDADGFLTITDRKKDIIVTAGGKNIAPQNLESLLKTVPAISQAVVVGDRRKYLTALVTLNGEAITKIAQKEGIPGLDMKELVKHPKIYSFVKKAIDEKNKGLAPYETIKRFAILEHDFTQEAGELTPTLKVKRKFVSEKYRDILDQLYQN